MSQHMVGCFSKNGDVCNCRRPIDREELQRALDIDIWSKALASDLGLRGDQNAMELIKHAIRCAIRNAVEKPLQSERHHPDCNSFGGSGCPCSCDWLGGCASEKWMPTDQQLATAISLRCASTAAGIALLGSMKMAAVEALSRGGTFGRGNVSAAMLLVLQSTPPRGNVTDETP